MESMGLPKHWRGDALAAEFALAVPIQVGPWNPARHAARSRRQFRGPPAILRRPARRVGSWQHQHPRGAAATHVIQQESNVYDYSSLQQMMKFV
jgi:hypothetical protein